MPPHPDQSTSDVARELAAVGERLRQAQDELDRVTRERRAALDRLAKLHLERGGAPPAPPEEPETPE